MKATLPPGSVTENYALFLFVGKPAVAAVSGDDRTVIGIIAGSFESHHQNGVPLRDHPGVDFPFLVDPSRDRDCAGGDRYWSLGWRHEPDDVLPPHLHSVDGNDGDRFRLDGASLNVYLRDTGQVVQVGMMLWFWITPIFITA